jgi:hypothetical protein
VKTIRSEKQRLEELERTGRKKEHNRSRAPNEKDVDIVKVSLLFM